MDFYGWVLLAIPDWVMGLLMAAAAWLCWRRFRRRGQRSILALIMPLLGFSLFYWWGVFFDPDPVAWIAGGRAVSFGIGAGIFLWALMTQKDNGQD